MTDKDLWVTRVVAGKLCGLSTGHFDEAIRPRLSGSAVRGEGRTLRFDAPAVVAALVAYRLEQHAPSRAATGDPDEALLYADADSPNLERLRGAKAALAEMDLQERQGTHADLRKLDSELMRFAGLIRRGGEVLQRRWGNDASDVFNEAIDGAEREWRAGRTDKPAA